MFTKLNKYTPLSRSLFLGGNTSIVRFYYSNNNWRQFNEGSCSIESVLSSGKESFPDISTKANINKHSNEIKFLACPLTNSLIL